MAGYAAVDGNGRLIAQGDQQIGTLERLREAAMKLIGVQEKAAEKSTKFHEDFNKVTEKFPAKLREILDKDFRKMLKEVFDPLLKAAERLSSPATPPISQPQSTPASMITAAMASASAAMKQGGKANDLDGNKANQALAQISKTMEMGQRPGSIYVHDTHVEAMIAGLNATLKALNDAIASSGTPTPGGSPGKGGGLPPPTTATATASPSPDDEDLANLKGGDLTKNVRSFMENMNASVFAQRAAVSLLSDMDSMAGGLAKKMGDHQMVLAEILKDMVEKNELDQIGLEKFKSFLELMDKADENGDAFLKNLRETLVTEIGIANNGERINAVIRKIADQSKFVHTTWAQIGQEMANTAKRNFAYSLSAFPVQLTSGLHAGMELNNVFKGIWGEQVKWNTQMRETLFMTQGLTATSEELRTKYMDIGRSAENVAATGMQLVDFQEAFLKNLQAGTKEMNTLTSVTRTGANLGFMIGADAKQTAKTFGDWQRQTGMSTTQMAQFAREVRAAGQNVGVMGDELVSAVQQARELADAMRDAGSLTASAAGSFTQFSASAKKFGAEQTVKPLLEGLSSTVNLFNKANEQTRTLLMTAAARTGRMRELMTGSVMQSPEAQKDIVRGMREQFSSLATQIAGTDKINRMNETQKMQLNMQLQAMYGMQLGQFQRTIDAMEEGTKSFDERIDDLNKKLMTNLTIKEREAVLDQKRGMELQNMLGNLTRVDESARDAQSMQEAFENIQTTQDEVRNNLMGSIERVNQSLAKSGKGESLIDSSRIEEALKDPVQYRELLEAINEGEQKAAVAQKAATDPVAQAIHILNERNAQIAENTGKMLAALTTGLGASGVLAMSMATYFLQSTVFQNTIQGLIANKLQNIEASLRLMLRKASVPGGGSGSAGETLATLSAEEKLKMARLETAGATMSNTAATTANTTATSANTAMTAEAAVAEGVDATATTGNTVATKANTAATFMGSIAAWAAATAQWAVAAAESALGLASGALLIPLGALVGGFYALFGVFGVVAVAAAVLYAAWKGLEASGISLSDVMNGLWKALQNLWTITSGLLDIVLWPLIKAFQGMFIVLKALFGWLESALESMAGWFGGGTKATSAPAAGADAETKAMAEAGGETADATKSMAEAFTKRGSGYTHDVTAEGLLREILATLREMKGGAASGGGMKSVGTDARGNPSGGLAPINWQPIQDMNRNLQGVANLPDPKEMMKSLGKLFLWLGAMGMVMGLVLSMTPLIITFTTAFTVAAGVFVVSMNACLLAVATAFGGLFLGAAIGAAEYLNSQVELLPDPISLVGSAYKLLAWVGAMALILLPIGMIATNALAFGASMLVAGTLINVAFNSAMAAVWLAFKGIMFSAAQGLDTYLDKQITLLPDPANLIEPMYELLTWIGGMALILLPIGAIASNALVFGAAMLTAGVYINLAFNSAMLAVWTAFRGIAFGMAIGIDKYLAEKVAALPNANDILEQIKDLSKWVANMALIIIPFGQIATVALMLASTMLTAGAAFSLAVNTALLAVATAFNGIMFSLVEGLDTYMVEQVGRLPDPTIMIGATALVLAWAGAMAVPLAMIVSTSSILATMAAAWAVAGVFFVGAMNALLTAVANAFDFDVEPLAAVATKLQAAVTTMHLLRDVGLNSVMEVVYTLDEINAAFAVATATLQYKAATYFDIWTMSYKTSGSTLKDKIGEMVETVVTVFESIQVDRLLAVAESFAKLATIGTIVKPDDITIGVTKFVNWLEKMSKAIAESETTLAKAEMSVWWWGVSLANAGSSFAKRASRLSGSVKAAFEAVSLEGVKEIVEKQKATATAAEKIDPATVKENVLKFINWLNAMNKEIESLTSNMDRAGDTVGWWKKSFVSFGQKFAEKMTPLIDSINTAFASLNLHKLEKIREPLSKLGKFSEHLDPEKGVRNPLTDFIKWANSMNDVLQKLTPSVNDAAEKKVGRWAKDVKSAGVNFSNKINELAESISTGIGSLKVDELKSSLEKVRGLANMPPADYLGDVIKGFVEWCKQANQVVTEAADLIKKENVKTTGLKTAAGEMGDAFDNMVGVLKGVFDRLDTGKVSDIGQKMNASVVDGLPSTADISDAFSALLVWAKSIETFVVTNGGRLAGEAMTSATVIKASGGILTHWFGEVIKATVGLFANIDVTSLKDVGKDVRSSVIDRMPTSERVEQTINGVIERIAAIAKVMPTMLAKAKKMKADHESDLAAGHTLGDVLQEVIDGFVGVFNNLATENLKGAGSSFTARVLSGIPDAVDLDQTFTAVENHVRKIAELMPEFKTRAETLQKEQAKNIMSGAEAGNILGHLITSFKNSVGSISNDGLKGSMASWGRDVVDSLPTASQFSNNFDLIVTRIQEIASRLPVLLSDLKGKMKNMASQLTDGDSLGARFSHLTARMIGIFDSLKTTRLSGLGSDFKSSIVAALPDPSVINETFNLAVERIAGYAKIMPEMRKKVDKAIGSMEFELSEGKEVGKMLNELMNGIRDVFRHFDLRTMDGLTAGFNVAGVASLKSSKEIEAAFTYFLKWAEDMAGVIKQGGPLDRGVATLKNIVSVEMRAQGERMAGAVQKVMDDVAAIFRRLSVANLAGAFDGFSLDMVKSLPESGEVSKVFETLKTKLVAIVQEAIPQIRAANQDLETKIGDLVRDGDGFSNQFQAFVKAITTIFKNISVLDLVSSVEMFMEGADEIGKIAIDKVNAAFTKITNWLKGAVGKDGPMPQISKFVNDELKGINYDKGVGESKKIKESIDAVAKTFQNLDVSAAVANWEILEDMSKEMPTDLAEMGKVVENIKKFILNAATLFGPELAAGVATKGPGGAGGGASSQSKAEATLQKIAETCDAFFTFFSDYASNSDGEAKKASDTKTAEVQSSSLTAMKQVESAIGQRLAETAPPAYSTAINQYLSIVASNTANTVRHLNVAVNVLTGILQVLAGGRGGAGRGRQQAAQPKQKLSFDNNSPDLSGYGDQGAVTATKQATRVLV